MTKGSRHSCRNDRVEKDLFSLREFPVEYDETTRTNYSEVQPGKYVETAAIEKQNMLNWAAHFTPLEEDKGADAFYNTSETVKKVLLGDDYSGPVYVHDDINPENNIGPRAESKTEREGKRRVVCKYPLEFDAEQYLDGDSVKNITRVRLGTGRPGDDRERHFKAMARALDIWKELKGLGIEKFSAGNSFWFAHPVYFLNHLDQAGLLDNSFNPYYGKTIKPRFAHVQYKDYTEVAQDNPGFAPATTKRGDLYNDRFTFQDKEDDQLYWASVNLLANKPYPDRTNIHNGVDFAGIDNETVIYSLIYGEVWAATYDYDVKNTYNNGTGRICYGICMVIRSRDEEILYILGHLSQCLLEPGSSVEPRQPIAIVGNTGYSSGAHLHLKTRKCSSEDRNEIIDPNKNIRWDVFNNDKNNRLTFRKNLQKVNPFKRMENIQ